MESGGQADEEQAAGRARGGPAAARAVLGAVAGGGGVVLTPMRAPPALPRHLALIAGVCRSAHVVGLRARRRFAGEPRWRFRNVLRCPGTVCPEWSCGWDTARGTLVLTSDGGLSWAPAALSSTVVTTGW